MDLSRLERKTDNEWWIAPYGKMRVPAVIFASASLIRDMDEKVYEQVTNVAKLPGIVQASYAMPDAHWGYGFPIGGVAAFDPFTASFCCNKNLHSIFEEFLHPVFFSTFKAATEGDRSNAVLL